LHTPASLNYELHSIASLDYPDALMLGRGKAAFIDDFFDKYRKRKPAAKGKKKNGKQYKKSQR
jgi:hypothetical protein